MEEVIAVDTESRIAQAIISCLNMIGDEARLNIEVPPRRSFDKSDAAPKFRHSQHIEA
jgi:hypothetical protein